VSVGVQFACRDDTWLLHAMIHFKPTVLLLQAYDPAAMNGNEQANAAAQAHEDY
jgi:hypothetical protein